jgi:hypothetical protein
MPTRHWHAAVPFPALTAVVGAAAAVGAIAGLYPRSEQPGSRRQKRSGACEPGDTSQLSASAAGRPAAAEPGHSAVSGQQPMGVGNLFAIPFGRLHDFRVPPKL